MKIKNIVFACLMGVSSIGVAATMSGCGLLGAGINKYDRLSELDEQANLSWANYESQLQRRADLIPNLVASVKGSAAHEHSTLKDVVEARSQAAQIKLTADDLSDPAKVETFKRAQSGLSGALSRLMVLKEAYPDLQANQQFHDLNVSLEGSENRILIARNDYNAAVKDFNFELRRVSGQALQVVLPSGRVFKARVYFSADPGSKVAPTVNFDSAPTPAPQASPTK